MTDNIQAILTVGVPTLAVLVGILVNGSRISDFQFYMEKRFDGLERRSDQSVGSMESRFDQRFEDLKETWRVELRRFELALDARLKHLEHKD